MSGDVSVLVPSNALAGGAASGRLAAPITVSPEKNVYSQNGEDGVLESILSRLGIGTGRFCEFGAWDGKHFSNCRSLYEQGWCGLFIEGDPRRFSELSSNYRGDERVVILNEFVRPRGGASLDAVFERLGIGAIDVLSIDIDGDDLLIWRSLSSVRPKVVVIEYNHTIPFDTRYENPEGENKGNSALAIVEFAHSNNYELVAGTATNLVFVDDACMTANLPRLTLWQFGQDCRGSRFFFGYDGELVVDTGVPSAVREYYAIPWTRFIGTQPIPKMLRGYERLQRTRLLYSLLGILVRRPVTLLRMLKGRLGAR